MKTDNRHQLEETVADRLRRVRRAHGLSQKALAARLNLRDSTITRYENADRQLTLAMAVKLAEVLGVDLYWLATGKERESTDTRHLARIAANLDTARDISAKVETQAETMRQLLRDGVDELERLTTFRKSQ